MDKQKSKYSFIKGNKVICKKCGNTFEPYSDNCPKCYSKSPLMSKLDSFYKYVNLGKENKKNKNYLEMLINCKNAISKVDIIFVYDELAFNEIYDGTSGPVIQVIDDFCHYSVAFGFYDELIWLRNFIDKRPKLAYYKEIIDKAFVSYEISKKIIAALKDNTHLVQNDLKKILNIKDVHLISQAVKYLEYIKNIRREKYKTSYKIILNMNFKSENKLDTDKISAKKKAGTGCVVSVIIFISGLIFLCLIN